MNIHNNPTILCSCFTLRLNQIPPDIWTISYQLLKSPCFTILWNKALKDCTVHGLQAVRFKPGWDKHLNAECISVSHDHAAVLVKTGWRLFYVTARQRMLHKVRSENQADWFHLSSNQVALSNRMLDIYMWVRVIASRSSVYPSPRKSVAHFYSNSIFIFI